MTIRNIKNPESTGGTGQFVIRTYRGSNMLDETTMHGVLGIGGLIKTLTSVTVALDGSGKSGAGEITKYVLSFKTNDFVPKNMYIKLSLPKDAFEVGERPSCSAFPINGILIKGKLSCVFNSLSQSIEVRGFVEDLQEGDEVGVAFTARNPNYSYTTDTFDLFLMKEGTTLAFARKLGVQGVPITSGQISQISMQPLDSFFLPNQQKLMWYKLSFKLKNPLLQGSIIQIKIPSTFGLLDNQVLGNPSSYYIESGIEDIDFFNPLKIEKITIGSNDYLEISNFKGMEVPNKIVIVMLITLPPSSGPSLPFEIRSYRTESALNEIDKDVSEATINVANVPAPLAHSVTSTVTVADGNSIMDLTFQITPSKTLPKNGQIKILIDENISSLGVDCNYFI